MRTIDTSTLPDLVVSPRLPDPAEEITGPSSSHHLFQVALDIYASVSDAADKILRGARRRATGTAVFTCNLDHLALMRRDETFRAAYRRAEVTTIDGAPLALLSRATGTRAARRVTGVDLTTAMLRLAEERDLRIALVGGAPGRAEEAATRLTAVHPGLPPIYTACPAMGFTIGDTDDDLLVEELEQYGPDVVIVCLGAPRQELWIDAHKHRFPGAVLVGAGATIDFLSGNTARAPRVVQRTGTEALWRLSTDFPRLWRRYLGRDVRFLAQFPIVVGSYTAARWGMSTSLRSHPHDAGRTAIARQASPTPCSACALEGTATR